MRAMLAVFSFMIVVAIGARYIVSHCEARIPKPAPAPATFVVPPAPKLENDRSLEPPLIYKQLHAYYAERFGSQKGFGSDRIIPTIQFHSIYKYSTQDGYGSLLIKNFELLGCSDGKPIVYCPDKGFLNFTKKEMKQMAEASRRPVNAFELAGLDKMRAGTDIIVKEYGMKAVVLGALRAKASCAKCHDVNEGELLGALIYTVEKNPDVRFHIMR